MTRAQQPDHRNAAFFEGYNACYAGVDESKNPHPAGADEHLSWNDGWSAASEELFPDESSEDSPK
jgi:ribosome modulation factor